ncbi:MAG: hypothetical protein Kow00127_03440 [Bacteroidales bacterium]
MKRYILTIFLATASLFGMSQSLYSFDYTMSFPSGKTADYIQSSSFRGFTFEGRGFVTDHVSLGGLFTWSTFYEKLGGETFTYQTATVTGNQYRYLNAYPILFQAHYYLGEDNLSTRAYFGGGVGPYKMVQRVNAGIWSVEENNWHFGFSPEVGILIPVSFTTSLNVSFRYHYVIKAKNTIDHSWFGLNLGLAWGD